MQEMADLLKVLDTKIENRPALALTILVGTWSQMKMFYHYQKSP